MFRLLICVWALLGLVSPLQAQSKEEALPASAIARLGAVRYRNVGRILTLAFSPDGKSLLAGAWDGSIRLWDVATGKELRQYTGHSGWVSSVAFAPDGKTIASGGKDKFIRVWETATGKELRRHEGHPQGFQYLAFSPDGKLLASQGVGEGILHLWEAASGREVRKLKVKPYAPLGTLNFAFSPDGKFLAYPADVHSMVVLDLASGKEVWRVARYVSFFRNLAYSSDGAILAAVSENNVASHPLLLWNAANGKELRPLVKGAENVWSLAFSPDRRLLVTAEGGYTLRVWELATRRERCRFLSPEKKPIALAFSPDGRMLAQGSDDITVLLWDVTGQQGADRPRSPTLTARELQALWEELTSEDAAAAYQAMGKLTVGAKDSVPFLREQLRPIASVNAGMIARLVADLDSERFQVRDRANEKLEHLDELAEPALRRGLQENPPLERRKRIERLLDRLAVQRDNPSPPRLRMLRAVEALEHMDTPAARQALEEYARGAPGAGLTTEANAALQRLAKRRR